MGLLKRKKEGHIVEQYTDAIYGKVDQDFKVDKRVSKIAKANPADFVEQEVSRHTEAQNRWKALGKIGSLQK